MILHNFHNSQIQWLVVSTPCQETKINLNPKVGSKGTPKFGPYWKLQLCCLTHGSEFSHGLNKLVTNLNHNLSWLKQVGHEFEEQ